MSRSPRDDSELRRPLEALERCVLELEARLARHDAAEGARAEVARIVLAAVERVERRTAELERELAALRRSREAAIAPGPRRVSAAVAARRVGVSPATMRRWIESGAVEGLVIRSGGRKRWSVEETSLERLERGAPGAHAASDSGPDRASRGCS